MKSAISTLDNFQSGRRPKVRIPPDQGGDGGSNPTRPHLVLASTQSSRGACDDITDAHHSYVKSSKRGARAVDYLIYSDETLIGTIGFAFPGVRLPGTLFAFYQIGQVKSGTPWVEKSRRIAVCYRYTLVRDMPKNFASQALGISLRLLRKEWKAKYDADLIGVFTLVKPPWTGSCFRAANFNHIGYTSAAEMTYTLEHHKTTIMAGVQLIILAYRYGRSAA